MSLPATLSLPLSPFPPLAAGFRGLGAGYLIYGPQELLNYRVPVGAARAA